MSSHHRFSASSPRSWYQPTRREFFPLMGTAALAALLVPVVPAFAQGNSPPSPADLAATQSGTLAGNSGGAYNSYQISNPSGSAVTLTLTYNPTMGGAGKGISLEAYQNGAQIGSLADANDTGSLTLTITPTKGAYTLVKVGNYMPGFTITYTLNASGLAAAMPTASPTAMPAASSTGTVMATPAATASSSGTATGPTELGKSVTGTLAGNSGGAYNSYQISSPSGSAVTLTVSYNPTMGGAGKGIALEAYQGTAQIGSLADVNDTGMITLTITPTSGTLALIKVGNYMPGFTISYTLTRS